MKLHYHSAISDKKDKKDKKDTWRFNGSLPSLKIKTTSVFLVFLVFLVVVVVVVGNTGISNRLLGDKTYQHAGGKPFVISHFLHSNMSSQSLS